MGKLDETIDFIIYVRKEYKMELEIASGLVKYYAKPIAKQKIIDYLEERKVAYYTKKYATLNDIPGGHNSFHIDDYDNHQHYSHP